MNSNQESAKSILELRNQLREQFPSAHKSTTSPPPDAIQTGASCLDGIGIPRGTLTEIIGPRTAPQSGGALLISAILESAVTAQRTIILIDGQDSFDPATNGAETCAQLLWARCRQASEAIQAADLLLRDGNLPLILMDLQLNAPKELNRIPGTTWFRLRNLAEQSAATLIAITPAPIITSAHQRLHFKNHHILTETKNQFRHRLQSQQQLHPTRQRQTLRRTA